MMMGVHAGGAGAAAAAAAQAMRMREEEEHLTQYTKEDLTDGWEFKIVRSSLRIKGNKFAQVCAEESQYGWELVEKFDDTRIRFKRKISNRAHDNMVGTDPYRTRFGMSDGAIVGIVLGISAAIVAITIGLVIFLS